MYSLLKEYLMLLVVITLYFLSVLEVFIIRNRVELLVLTSNSGATSAKRQDMFTQFQTRKRGSVALQKPFPLLVAAGIRKRGKTLGRMENSGLLNRKAKILWRFENAKLQGFAYIGSHGTCLESKASPSLTNESP